MSERGWWTLTFTTDNLTDDDRENISRLVAEGFTSGEIIQDDLEEENDADVENK